MIIGLVFFVGFFDEKPEGEQAEEAIAALEEEIEETENAGGMEPKTLEIDSKFQVSYFKIPDNFTANVKSSRKVVQVGFSIAPHFDKADMLDEELSAITGEVNGMVPRHMEAIKSAILLEQMEFSEDQLTTRSGKEEMRDSIRVAINAVLEKHEKLTTDAISDVLITSFLILRMLQF